MLTYLTEKFLPGNGRPETEILEGSHKSCLPCRLIAGFGLVGSGGYVGYEAMKRKTPFQKYIMVGIASGFIGLGVARLFLLPPFHSQIQETSN